MPCERWASPGYANVTPVIHQSSAAGDWLI